jgi:hypothetical protein
MAVPERSNNNGVDVERVDKWQGSFLSLLRSDQSLKESILTSATRPRLARYGVAPLVLQPDFVIIPLVAG